MPAFHPTGRGTAALPRGVAVVVVLPLMMMLSGCALWNPVGPDYTPPVIDAPDQWQTDLVEGFGDGQAALEVWWESFQDPLLSDLMAAARDGNRSLMVVAARVDEAAAQRGIARSQWFPGITGQGSAQAVRSSEFTTPFLPPSIDRETSFYLLGADASWEIDFWGRVRRAVESAQAGYEAGVEDYRDALVTLYGEVALAYIDARTAQARLGYAEANLERQAETLALTRARFKAGLVPELDVRQAELNRARTAATLPRLRTALAVATHRLGVLVGEGPQALTEILAPAAAVPLPPEAIWVGIPAEVLRQRPDVRRAERQLAAQTARIGVATGDLYPRFSLFGSFSLESIDASDLLKGEAFAYGMGPAFRWEIFSAGRVRSLIRVEEARTEQAFQSYEQTVLQALEEMENALVTLAEDRLRHASLDEAVVAARYSVDQVLVLYRNGLTDFQNVLNMEQALAAAQDDLAVSQGDLARDAVRVYRAAGGGWNPSPERQE